jgi:hypothetical protein
MALNDNEMRKYLKNRNSRHTLEDIKQPDNPLWVTLDYSKEDIIIPMLLATYEVMDSEILAQVLRTCKTNFPLPTLCELEIAQIGDILEVIHRFQRSPLGINGNDNVNTTIDIIFNQKYSQTQDYMKTEYNFDIGNVSKETVKEILGLTEKADFSSYYKTH